ncbi:MAG TPA: nuclear transport factor 2 family protein [Candidatus Nanopelagicaceae bacterium]|nr:nuclear transport factor 2 family protein [Candidatus Nanopelagicaceae bacterium]
MEVTVTSDAGGTREAVEAMYDAYLGGRPIEMTTSMVDDVWIRFLGHADFHGLERAKEFFSQNNEMFSELEFEIERVVIDGEYAATLWTERAITSAGEPWFNHGVDVFHVRDGLIRFVHENNDISTFRHHFG